MGKDQLNQLKYHKKKRDFFLFFLLCIFFLVPGSFIALVIADVNMDTITLIYFPVFLITLFVIFRIRSKLMYHSMYYQYFLMIEDNLGIIKLSHKIFTPSWLGNLKNKGFIETSNLPEFLTYYQVMPKIKKYVYAKSLVMICIIAKNETLDFYASEVDDELKKIYTNNKEANKSRRHIILHFKKYQNYSEAVKEELDKIINFKIGRDNLIHINIGYFVNQNAVYFLRPSKKYPNKYYYYAVQMIKELCGIS